MNSPIPQEIRDHQSLPPQVISQNPIVQIPQASFTALNKLSPLDVENLRGRNYTEYVRHALFCGENIANRNEQKYCFRNIEGICRRTRHEVEKENSTARNLYTQGHTYAIKDLIFALARATNCWRILIGYYSAIENNSLNDEVNTEISDDFLECFAEWEKHNRRLTHNLFLTFSNLHFLYTDEEVSQSQNEASRPRHTHQPCEQTNPPRKYREKTPTGSKNINNIGQEKNQSEARGIACSPEYGSSYDGENKKQSPVDQYQSAQSSEHSTEENKSPPFIFIPEQFPPLGERVRKCYQQPSMKNGGPSSSTGAIRKKINSNFKAKKTRVDKKQAEICQKQSSTESVVTDPKNIENIQYVGPSTGAIKKTVNLNKPKENQIDQVGANSEAIQKTASIDLKQEPILSHREQFPTHFVQPLIQNTGSNNDVMEITDNHGFEKVQTSAVNQEFSTNQMQYPTANTDLGNKFISQTNEHTENTSVGYHQANHQSLPQQMQPSTINTGLKSDFIKMTNYYGQQPLTNTYLQSPERYESQYNSDQTTTNYGYGRGSYEASRRGAYEPNQRGLHEASSNGSCEPSRRGSYGPSRRGSYETSRRGSYEPYQRGLSEASGGGLYEFSKRGSYEPSKRGLHEPSRRGSYDTSRRGSYESCRGQAYDSSRRGRYHDHFAYDRGISLIPKGYNYLVQFSHKAMNIDKYEEQLLKDAELLAKNSAMTVLNDQADNNDFDTKLKAKHADMKILSIKLKKIWIRLEETHFMVQNREKTHFLITLYCAVMNKPANLLAIGERILNLFYSNADQFIEDVRHILLYSTKFFADDIGYQINLAMFKLIFNDLLKEVFPDLNGN